MRKKKFNTDSSAIARDAMNRGYKVISCAYWAGTQGCTFFLQK